MESGFTPFAAPGRRGRELGYTDNQATYFQSSIAIPFARQEHGRLRHLPSLISVEIAVHELKAAGFRNTDISVLFPESAGTSDFAHEKNTKAYEGATSRGGTGAILGGALGWLIGIGALAIRGVGPFIAAGPIVAALAGAEVGETVGGIAGALIGIGRAEYEAKRYEGNVKNGGILLSVHSETEHSTNRANETLRRTGA